MEAVTGVAIVVAIAIGLIWTAVAILLYKPNKISKMGG